jgi:uncharacterized protein
MSNFFFDSSALVKRYVVEPGTTWIQSILDPAAGHVVFVSELTRVEVAAALAARHRAPKGISRQQRDGALNLLLHHFLMDYSPLAINPAMIGDAVALTQKHRLRGYDALQLATALAANRTLLATGLAPISFLASDRDLLKAASSEGLAIENPSLHL